MIIKDLVRKNIQDLAPYSSARDEFKGLASVMLDANENNLGSPNNDLWMRYPDPQQKNLKQELAKLKGVETSNIFMGNGSDEAIDLVIRVFCEPGTDNIVVFTPTYGMYSVSAAINNVGCLEIPLGANFQLPEIKEYQTAIKDAKVIFLCSPNNPTGNLLEKNKVLELIDNFTGIVVIDEAYIDFCAHATNLPLVLSKPNVIVLQTFSKAWGIAGLRLGVAYANPEIISYLNKAKPPYNVNAFTQQEALKIMGLTDKLNQHIKQINLEKARLATEFRLLPFVDTVYPSDANFILVKVKDANKLYHYCTDNKLVIRNRNKEIEGCVRITIGTQPENNILLNLLRSYKSN